MKKLLSTSVHRNTVLTSVLFYWALFIGFYVLSFFYAVWRLWNGHDVTPQDVLFGGVWYKAEGWTGFRKKRRILINKQFLARY